MRTKVLISIVLAITVVFGFSLPEIEVSSQAPKSVSTGLEKPLTVEVSSTKGTAVFEAKMGGIPASEVEVRIDNERKGSTDDIGRLRVKWLIAGKHSWSAFYKGREILQGEFEIPEVIDAEIIDRGVIMGEEEFRESFKIYPLKDRWTVFVAVKNTGTTMVDHFAIDILCAAGEESSIKVKLISPKIPSKLWEPFMRDMLNRCGRNIEVVVKDGELEMIDSYTQHPMDNVRLRTPISKEGIRPGEVITIEFEEAYRHCLEEFMEGMALELGTEVTTEVVDEENGIMRMMIKEYKLGPFRFRDIKGELCFKGPNKRETCSFHLYIDGELCDSASWLAYEWL